MKLLTQIIIFVILYVAYANGTAEETAKNGCMKKLSITPEEFNKSNLQDSSDKMKCFWDCYGKEMGLGNSDNPNIDELLKYYMSLKNNLPADEVKTVLLGCKSKITGNTDCDKSYSYVRCVYTGLKL